VPVRVLLSLYCSIKRDGKTTFTVILSQTHPRTALHEQSE